MGAVRKMAVYLGLVEEDLERFDDEPIDDRYEAAARRSQPEHVRVATRPDPARSDLDTTRSQSVRPSTRPSRSSEVDLRERASTESIESTEEGYRITTLHPRSYNDARRLGEEFRQHVPVIMNLTEMNDIDAKRLIDFSAGLVFGLHGSIERVTNKVFLLSPANVDVGAEARKLAQDGFFNQS